jgi:Family of unknown function (DUF5677)
MNGLQLAIEQALGELPVLALGNLMKRKLAEQGVEIDDPAAESLARDLLAGKSKFSLPGEREDPLQITFSGKDADDISSRVGRFLENDLGNLLQKSQEDTAAKVFKTLRKRWPSEFRRQKNEISDFRRRLNARWKTGISKLHMLVTMARELGDNINGDARRNPEASGAALVDVLTRLQARSCQVAEEVIVLLETGFANGALARWRTMHEIAVAAVFISEHGNACAERYIDHQIVESYKGALEYQAVQAKLGYKPISSREMEEIRQQYEAMLSKHGKAFAGQYGWASANLKGRQPTFKEIEKAAKTDQLRGHYRMASHGVHANPKGIFFSIASIFPTNLLLAGPSNSGLADAGEAAAHSLLVASAALLSLSPTFDHQVAVRMMGILKGEIGLAFFRSHEKLCHEEEEIRAAEARALESVDELEATKDLQEG